MYFWYSANVEKFVLTSSEVLNLLEKLLNCSHSRFQECENAVRDCVRKLMCMTVFASGLEKPLFVSPSRPPSHTFFFSNYATEHVISLKFVSSDTYFSVFINFIIHYTHIHKHTASNPTLAAIRKDSRSAVSLWHRRAILERGRSIGFEPRNTWLRLSILSLVVRT